MTMASRRGSLAMRQCWPSLDKSNSAARWRACRMLRLACSISPLSVHTGRRGSVRKGNRLSHAQPTPFPLAYDSAPYRNRSAVGTVTAACSGACRRSIQHAVERLRQPDGSVLVRRICTECDAVEQFKASKVAAERALTVEAPKADPVVKDNEMAEPRSSIDSECCAADNGPTKP